MLTLAETMSQYRGVWVRWNIGPTQNMLSGSWNKYSQSFFFSMISSLNLLRMNLKVWISAINIWTRLGCFYVTVEVEVKVEVELRLILRLRWKWGWYEVESKSNWNWVEVQLSWGWDKLTLNKGRNWPLIGLGLWLKICFRSTIVAEQHMFSM